MLLSTFFFALMQVCVKWVPHIPAEEIIVFRCVISLLISWAFLRKAGVSVWGNNRKLLLARGASGAVALILFFNVLQNLPLATAATLQYLSPIFTAILGIFIVKERIRAWQWVFFLISFAGVLVIEGVETSVDTSYLWLGVLSAVFAGVAYSIVRKLNVREHPLVIIFYFPLVTLPVVGIYTIFNWVQPVGWEWAMLLLVGLFTQLGQYYMTLSYQHEEISKVANLTYIGIIYALILGFVFFGELLNFWTYLGMGLVLLGVLLNVQYKNHLTRQATLAAVKDSEEV